MEIARRRITIFGRVQGLGVRPAIARLAAACGVGGSVANDARGVTIDVEGPAGAVATFEAALPGSLPTGAVIDLIESHDRPPTGATRFEIVAGVEDDGPLVARVPPDRGVCDACLRESFDPADRRFAYPFTSCTTCGPRFSLIRAMPYERVATSMDGFPLCPMCRREYEAPSDRRFHAETTACPACGPHVWLTDRTGARVAVRTAAVEAAADHLIRGKIVALRGVGGYQLLCDAADDGAIDRLRRFKQRPSKPMAVMVESLAAAESIALLSEAERAALADASNPIVIVTSRPESDRSSDAHVRTSPDRPNATVRSTPADSQGSLAVSVSDHRRHESAARPIPPRPIAPGVSADLRTIGLMLPSSPLHAQLARRCGRPLVVTSGNGSGEPLIVEVDEAQRKLAEVADAWLHHDRPIAHPVDDSVVRVIAGRRATMRLARGFAPLPLRLPAPLAGRALLAVGGHQKAAVAVSNGAQAVLGPHVGDLDSPALRRRWADTRDRMERLLRATPGSIAHDLHPDYHATRWATDPRADGGSGRATIAVQHHHAHVVAGMIEHGWLDREVLGVAFDGAGYGPDGTIQGGEFLLCTARSYRRVARLRPFPLLGGDAAARQPWRVVLALLDGIGRLDALDRYEAMARHDASAPEISDAQDRGGPAAMFERRNLLGRANRSPFTSSMGRLFDGVAGLALGLDAADHEGEPAMRLEDACDAAADGWYRFPIVEGDPLTLEWRPLVEDILNELAAGVAVGHIAMKFHRSLARAVADVCRRFAALPVVLSGGVFQNRTLVEEIVGALGATGQPLGLPGEIPVNDGGLAAGQLAVGLYAEGVTLQSPGSPGLAGAPWAG